MPKLIFLVSEDWYFVSHRLHLAARAVQEGFEVSVCTRPGNQQKIIEAVGATVIAFEQQRRGLNPFGLLTEAWRLSAIYRAEKPDLVHHVALRSVVVGELAAWLAGVRGRVSAITGFGYLFTGGGRRPLARIALEKILPRLLSRSRVIVQNGDDASVLATMGIARDQIHLIAGAGVDAERFAPRPHAPGPAVVMLASRMLWDKGVGEFVDAARQLKASGARFVLVGMVDVDNPSCIPEAKLRQWVAEGVVEWWGHRSDMADCLNEADIVCLPSYREGFPKALLEAMACGKPCITTDVTGCRDAVRHGDNGLLVPVKDAHALAGAMQALLMDAEAQQRMGARGRARVLEEFSLEQVSNATFDVYRQALARS